MSDKPKSKAAVEREQPTKASIQALLNSLSGSPYGCSSRDEVDPLYAEYRRLDDEADALEKKLTDVPELRKAREAAKAARSRYEERRREVRTRVTKVQRLLWAKGLTPAVLKKVDELVEEVNSL